jgi:hypothetical protein
MAGFVPKPLTRALPAQELDRLGLAAALATPQG